MPAEPSKPAFAGPACSQRRAAHSQPQHICAEQQESWTRAHLPGGASTSRGTRCTCAVFHRLHRPEDRAQPVPRHALPAPGSALEPCPALPGQAAQSRLQLPVLGTRGFTGTSLILGAAALTPLAAGWSAPACIPPVRGSWRLTSAPACWGDEFHRHSRTSRINPLSAEPGNESVSPNNDDIALALQPPTFPQANHVQLQDLPIREGRAEVLQAVIARAISSNATAVVLCTHTISEP